MPKTTSTVPPFADPAEPCDAPSCARDRIFQAARKLFYRHGVRGVSVDAIAAEAGTTKVTLYRVFDSKDDLIVQCVQDHKQRFWKLWGEMTAPYAGEPRKQIEAVIGGLTGRICAKEADRGCPLLNTAVEIDDENHPAKSVVREHNAEINRRLRALCHEMGARHPDALGDSLTLLLEGVFASRMFLQDAGQLQTVSKAAQALLDSELGAPARSAARAPQG